MNGRLAESGEQGGNATLTGVYAILPVPRPFKADTAPPEHPHAPPLACFSAAAKPGSERVIISSLAVSEIRK